MVNIFPEDDDSDESVSFEKYPDTNEVLKTSKTKCEICGVGDIVKHRSKLILVYGRNGIKKVKHEEFRCNFRNQDVSCRAGYWYGYTTYQGLRIYDDDALKKDILIVTNQSAFEIEYLVELTSEVELYAAGFDTAAKKFNRYHNFNLPQDTLNKRNKEFPMLSFYSHIWSMVKDMRFQIIK